LVFGPDAVSDATDKVAHPLPTPAINGLVPALLRVYALAHDPSSAPVTATSTKELKDATEGFKTRLNVARTLIEKLPGGDLTSKEQDEIIKMLEDMRDYKRTQIQQHLP